MNHVGNESIEKASFFIKIRKCEVFNSRIFCGAKERLNGGVNKSRVSGMGLD